jgi:hypothetical protein
MPRSLSTWSLAVHGLMPSTPPLVKEIDYLNVRVADDADQAIRLIATSFRDCDRSLTLE